MSDTTPIARASTEGRHVFCKPMAEDANSLHHSHSFEEATFVRLCCALKLQLNLLRLSLLICSCIYFVVFHSVVILSSYFFWAAALINGNKKTEVEEQNCFTLSFIFLMFYWPTSASLGNGKCPSSLFLSIYAFSCACWKSIRAMA